MRAAVAAWQCFDSDIRDRRISFAMTRIYDALDLGKVSVVIAISGTAPFFPLILSALFLRDVERVTSRVVFGAAMIVVGVILISLCK